jgi:hypothetical protein
MFGTKDHETLALWPLESVGVNCADCPGVSVLEEGLSCMLNGLATREMIALAL